MMQDFVNTVALICAAIASLGFGVLLAFGLCRAGFVVMRAHTLSRREDGLPAKTQIAEA
jgi:hypothetical protein